MIFVIMNAPVCKGYFDPNLTDVLVGPIRDTSPQSLGPSPQSLVPNPQSLVPSP